MTSKITSIGENAFRECENLIELQIQPKSNLEIIEKEAFSLTKINQIQFQSDMVELKEGWNHKMLELNTQIMLMIS